MLLTGLNLYIPEMFCQQAQMEVLILCFSQKFPLTDHNTSKKKSDVYEERLKDLNDHK